MLTARVAHPEGLAASLNWWVLHIALPAMVLVQVVKLEWSADLLFPGAAMWLVFIGAWVLIELLGRLRGWSRSQVGALVLTAGLGNTSFVGYPLIEALRGHDALGIAVIADQLGSFLALSTAGVFVAARYAGQSMPISALFLRVLKFPAFLALMLALVIRAVGGLPEWSDQVLTRLGGTLTPLALFSVGMQLRFSRPGHDAEPLFWGLLWKLLLAPLAVWALVVAWGVPTLIGEVSVLQAAMAPMITAGILAQQHGLAPSLSNRMVGLGILLSLVTVSAASFLI